MADDGEIDIEGEFDFKLEVEDGFYDANELPSKSANLLPEFTNPPWMLEQGWTMDGYMDEKSKATIERMLMEEQQYLNGRSKTKLYPLDKSPSSSPAKSKPNSSKRPWNEEEKQLFLKGLDLYGRSWTRISEIIPSRTSLQVKNYAQQYFKNLAKKAEAASTVETSTSQGIALVSTELGSRLTQPTDPLASVLASVTTAQPTVTSLPATLSQTKHHKTKRKTANRTGTRTISNKSHTNGLDGVLPAANTIVGISGLQDIQCGSYSGTLDTSDLSPSVNLSGVGFLSGSKELGFDSSVGTLIHIASGLDTLAAVVENDLTSGDIQSLVSVAADCTDSEPAEVLGTPAEKDGSPNISEAAPRLSSKSFEEEEEDVDIDIENDDDNDNPLLLARSASPTSVYEKLLRSANVTPTHSKNGDDSDSCGAQTDNSVESDKGGNSEDKVAPAKTEAIFEVEQDGLNEENPGEKLDSQLNSNTQNIAELSEEYCKEDVPKVEERIIVNGITMSSGEIIEFPIPSEERILEPEEISEEERKIHSEFFDGRQSKTPERYLKIRNHIIDCWKKCRPNFLNKTSVRTGLKNCGDVNCIGRIHCFLECTGTINFGCEQAAYNNPAKTVSTSTKVKHTTGREGWIAAVVSEKIDSMRPRKRRIRDSSGHWVDEKELEGKTIEHKVGEEKKAKAAKMMRVSYDPFKLIPCLNFSEEKPAPFSVLMSNTALAVMDVHAHISKTEVIGMLGGVFRTDQATLDIRMALPCNSLSTGMQCEMDPVSQTQASEQIAAAGLIVVGWYHSHPTFAPNPSIRDIETQLKFQDWFAKGGNQFVGVIVSPYNKMNSGIVSEVKCLTIGADKSQDNHTNLPYEFDYDVAYSTSPDMDLVASLIGLADKYSTNSNRVVLSHPYRVSLGISCLAKMLQSVRSHLMEPEKLHNLVSEYDDALQLLEETFLKLSPSDSRHVLDTTSGGEFGEPLVSDIHIDDVETFVPVLPQIPVADSAEIPLTDS